ncbi:MAG: hypothetical protein LBM13_03260, partial [Candidatus Ancillula sp.]|nr:hypothetical protein [Candidatus Ancillula sp.]
MNKVNNKKIIKIVNSVVVASLILTMSISILMLPNFTVRLNNSLGIFLTSLFGGVVDAGAAQVEDQNNGSSVITFTDTSGYIDDDSGHDNNVQRSKGNVVATDYTKDAYFFSAAVHPDSFSSWIDLKIAGSFSSVGTVCVSIFGNDTGIAPDASSSTPINGYSDLLVSGTKTC